MRLAGFAGQHAWRDQVDRLFDGLLPLAADNLFMHVALLNALDLRLRATEIVVAGQGERADALTAAALKLPFLDRIVVRAPSADALPPTHPAAAKLAAVSEPAAFVCAGETCSLPVTAPEQIAATLRIDAALARILLRRISSSLQSFKTAARRQLCDRAPAATLPRVALRGGGRWCGLACSRWRWVCSRFVQPWRAEHNVRVELNTLESTETHCRLTFVIENKAAKLDSLKLDLVVFNTESIVYRRIITELGPVRAGRTIVRIFEVEAKCAQIGAVLVNDVAACVPGEPDGLPRRR